MSQGNERGKWLHALSALQRSKCLAPFLPVRLSLICAALLCQVQEVMRLLIEALVIAGLIFVGWNKPFHEYADQANTKITSALDSMGGSLQKNQDKSVKRY